MRFGEFSHENPLTASQEKRRRSIEIRIQRALRDLRDLAAEAGCGNPHLFYECEGSLCVFDYDRGDPGEGGANARQEKVALSVNINPSKGTPALDCGAW